MIIILIKIVLWFWSRHLGINIMKVRVECYKKIVGPIVATRGGQRVVVQGQLQRECSPASAQSGIQVQ